MADVDITPLGNRRGIDSKCRLRLRLEVLSAYGGACACCGEATYEFLAIDHINGGGSRHRKETARRSIYPWLRRSGYPPGYRVLCHNCNMATGMYGACPHKTRTPGQASPSIPRKMDTSIDLTGLKFGRLTVVSRDGTCGADNKILWRCACECGGVGLVTTCRLRSGKTRSCGCMRIDSTRKRFTSHGKSSTPEYEIWQAMRARCYRRTSESFADYSEHGIGIAKQWGNFSKFYEDMGPRPSPSHRLTRTDKTRNFEPSNCKWTASTREKNRKDSMNELALFAGVGGGILASRALGHNVVCAVEIDPFCREILLWRQRDGVLGMFPVWDDVRTFDGDPWRGKVDLVSAGFPCPPFSVAGKQRAGADERNMWPATLEVIRRVRPSYVFLENVPGLLAGSHGYFGTVLAGLADAGFDAEWACLSAAEVGAPHKRDRVWVWAYLPDTERVVLRDEPGRSGGAGGPGTGVAGDDGAAR